MKTDANTRGARGEQSELLEPREPREELTPDRGVHGRAGVPPGH